MTKTTEVKVRLDGEEERLLARLAKKEGVNRSEILRRSLRAYDDREREQLALEKLLSWAEADEKRLAGAKLKKTPFRVE